MTERLHSSLSKRRASYSAAVFCALICGVVSVLMVIGASRSGSNRSGEPEVRWAATMTPARARSALDALGATELSPEVAYDREANFGRPWVDVDNNGCDTRDDILRRDLTHVRDRQDGDRCEVQSGELTDPYTGTLLVFERSAANTVQIDHLVPLHAAWQLGAWRWTPARRLAFANDPRELIAVSGPANQEKGDSLVDRWRPGNRGVWCTYAIETIGVHADYDLGVTRSERRTLISMLGHCG